MVIQVEGWLLRFVMNRMKAVDYLTIRLFIAEDDNYFEETLAGKLVGTTYQAPVAGQLDIQSGNITLRIEAKEEYLAHLTAIADTIRRMA